MDKTKAEITVEKVIRAIDRAGKLVDETERKSVEEAVLKSVLERYGLKEEQIKQLVEKVDLEIVDPIEEAVESKFKIKISEGLIIAAVFALFGLVFYFQ